jgi:hypothetical protein
MPAFLGNAGAEDLLEILSGFLPGTGDSPVLQPGDNEYMDSGRPDEDPDIRAGFMIQRGTGHA